MRIPGLSQSGGMPRHSMVHAAKCFLEKAIFSMIPVMAANKKISGPERGLCADAFYPVIPNFANQIAPCDAPVTANFQGFEN